MTTPETLREEADRLLTGGPNYLPLRNRLRAAADAWEADRQTIRDTAQAVMDYLVLVADNVSLRTRLAEAEKYLRMLRDTISAGGMVVTFSDHDMEQLAALAHDKGKP